MVTGYISYFESLYRLERVMLTGQTRGYLATPSKNDGYRYEKGFIPLFVSAGHLFLFHSLLGSITLA